MALAFPLVLGACGGGGDGSGTVLTQAPGPSPASAGGFSPLAPSPTSGDTHSSPAPAPAPGSAMGPTTAPAPSPAPTTAPTPAPTPAPSASPAPSEPPAPSPAPPATPPAEPRYALGPVTVANDTTAGFQTLEGMALLADGGYSIVWMTASFDSSGAVRRDHFEQRYDAAGRRVGAETAISPPTDDLSGSRAGRVQTPSGGYVEFTLSDQLRPGLYVQHFSADGEALDPPIALGGASHGWSAAAVLLPSGAIALTWQALSSVGPGELQTALLVPGPR